MSEKKELEMYKKAASYYASEVGRLTGEQAGYAILHALRREGWTVANHIDYRSDDGELCTLWIMNKGEQAVKGSAGSDFCALWIIANRVAQIEGVTLDELLDTPAPERAAQLEVEAS